MATGLDVQKAYRPVIIEPMKKRESMKRESIMLLLPVAVLASIGLLTHNKGPLLTVTKRQTSRVTSALVKGTAHEGSDTQILVTMRYRSANPWKQFISGPNYRDAERDAFLVDQRGKVYRKFKIGVHHGTVNYPVLCYLSGSGDSVEVAYRFPLHEIPKAAGKITFKAKLSVDHGFVVPISTVVRH